MCRPLLHLGDRLHNFWDILAASSYNRGMARGWESKSVEEQQSEAAHAITSAETKDRITKEKAERARKLQGLTLMRARVKEQLERSQNPRYVEVLRSELDQIEKQIQELG